MHVVLCIIIDNAGKVSQVRPLINDTHKMNYKMQNSPLRVKFHYSDSLHQDS